MRAIETFHVLSIEEAGPNLNTTKELLFINIKEVARHTQNSNS